MIHSFQKNLNDNVYRCRCRACISVSWASKIHLLVQWIFLYTTSHLPKPKFDKIYRSIIQLTFPENFRGFFMPKSWVISFLQRASYSLPCFKAASSIFIILLHQNKMNSPQYE